MLLCENSKSVSISLDYDQSVQRRINTLRSFRIMGTSHDPTARKAKKAGHKRKRILGDDDNETAQAKKVAFGQTQSKSGENLNLGREKKPESQKQSMSNRNANMEVDDKLAKLNPYLLADYVSQKIRYRFRRLDSTVIESKYLSSQVFYDTSSFDKPRNLDNLPSFLKTFSANGDQLSSSYSEPSCPHTVIMAASGLRAADVTRSLREFQSKDAAVAKLFAKHIKITQAIEYVKRTRYVSQLPFSKAADVDQNWHWNRHATETGRLA